MHVLKFGGTSMGDEHTWRRVLDIISRYERPFVVVSATARTTRQLLAAAEKAIDDIAESRKIADEIRERHLRLIICFMNHYPKADSSVVDECELWIDKKIAELESYLSQIKRTKQLGGRLKDAIASIGEQLSSYLFARCGTIYGLSMEWIDAAEIIRTDAEFEQATPDEAFIKKQAARLKKNHRTGKIPVMGGYYGSDENGAITTLGFEGSDYTAGLMGAAFSADAIEIWTDVSGIYTCDPRVIPDARPIPELSFQEATELAYFGAKVLHPSTTKPAAQQQIPILIKNIFEPDQPGTCITAKTEPNGRAKALTFKEHCVILTVTSTNTVMGYEFLADIFSILKTHHLPVDVVTTTEASVSIALGNSRHIESIVEKLRKRAPVEIKNKQAVISLIGCSDNEIQSLVNDMLSAVTGDILNLISFSHSKHNLNVVIDQDAVLPAVEGIHKRIFE
jgi:aspartate kinase